MFVCWPLFKETHHESLIVYAPFPSHHPRPRRYRLASITAAAGHHHHHHYHKGGAAAAAAAAHGRNAAGAGGVGASGKRGVSPAAAAAAAAAEDEEMKALVARHNKRFKAQQAPAYVPTLGVRDTRKVSRGFVFSLFVYVWGGGMSGMACVYVWNSCSSMYLHVRKTHKKTVGGGDGEELPRAQLQRAGAGQQRD